MSQKLLQLLKRGESRSLSRKTHLLKGRHLLRGECLLSKK